MPEIKPVKELRFRSPNAKLTVLTQVFHPNTDRDFVSTSGSVKRDVSFFAIGSARSGAGVAVDAFYIGANVIKDFQLGDNLFIKNSKDKDVVITHLDGVTTVNS